MPGVSGNFDALNAMVRQIEAIAGTGPRADAFRTGMLTQCAEAARGEVDRQFIATIDPYGRQWKPLKSRKGKPLSDTGRLASSFTYTINGSGFEVVTNVAYAPFHQYGAFVPPHSRIGGGERMQDLDTGRFLSASKAKKKKLVGIVSWKRQTYATGITIPRRQMIPEADTGGIGNWGAALNEEAEVFMERWLKV